MIDTRTETLLTLPEAAKIIPKLGDNHLHPSTIWRWCKFGLDGVKLEYVRVGTRICTTEAALNRFFNRNNGASNG